MQVFVIGMHRSGTSVASRLLNMMGLYFGAEGSSTGSNPENPKGFWERRDVRDLNDYILQSNGFDWNKIGSFNSVDEFGPDSVTKFHKGASQLILSMDAHRPWFLKEPRFCLTFPLWQKHLELPICLFVFRNPIEVAKSLSERNGFPFHYSLALWEKYNIVALRSTAKLRRVVLSYNKLMDNPTKTIGKLFDDLNAFKIPNLRCPEALEIRSFIDEDLYRQKATDEYDLLTASQKRLFADLQVGDLSVKHIRISETLNETLIDFENTIGKLRDLQLQNKKQEEALKLVEGKHAAEHQALKNKLNEMQEQLAKSRESCNQIKELNTALVKKDKELASQLNDLKAQLAKKELMVANQLKDLMELRNTNDAQRKEIQSYTQKLDEYQKDEKAFHVAQMRFAEISAKYTEQEKYCSILKEDNKIRLDQIVQLENLQVALTAEINEFRDTVSEQAEIIKSKENIILNQIALLRTKEQEAIQRDKLLARRSEELGNLQWRIQADRQRVQYLETQIHSKDQMISDFWDRIQSMRLSNRFKQILGLYRLKKSIVTENTISNSMEDVSEHLATTPLTEPTIASENESSNSDSIETPATPTVEIIIPVFNALEHVRKCLFSILEKASYEKLPILIINDGSDKETSDFLTDIALIFSNAKVIVNKESIGYTRSINVGLKLSSADYLILLNSDTVIPPNFVERILKFGKANSEVGIFGPLSNAASYQSVPDIKDGKGNWANNVIPNEMSVDQWDKLISERSDKAIVEVPIVNGFCFIIKREVINAIGYFDEESFPKGYGEENDYCIRATSHGFKCAIMDNLFVFHAKSQSFGAEKRKILAREGRSQLEKKHGKELLNSQIQLLEKHFDLEKIRKRVHSLSSEVLNMAQRRDLSILFYLPVKGGGGGAHSVVQEAVGLRNIGVEVRVANLSKYKRDFQLIYNDIVKEFPDMFLFFKEESHFEKYLKHRNYDFLIGTIFHSMDLVARVTNTNKMIKPAYYAQDFEPLFFPDTDPLWKKALASYTLHPDVTIFSKTEWLCSKIENETGVKVLKVNPSLDTSLYYPGKLDFHANHVRIAAMIRPRTPRRGAHRTMKVLSRLKAHFGDAVVINLFGSTQQEIVDYKLENDFDYVDYGILMRNEVANLLRQSDFFLDFSDYQAFGRTGLEAMACGCIPVLTDIGGVYEYAVDNTNSFLVDVSDEDVLFQKMKRIVETQPASLIDLKINAVLKSSEYSIERAAWSEYLMFSKIKNANRRENGPFEVMSNGL